MSSAVTRRFAGWSLQARLVAALVALLAVVCVVVGGITQMALRRSLVDQLDAQLMAAAGRSGAFREPPRGGGEDRPPPGPRFILAPGQAAGTLGARVVGDRVDEAAVLDDSGTPLAVSSAANPALVGLPSDGRPHTRELGALGDYRLIATRAPNGDVLVTGLPLAKVQETVVRQAAVIVIVVLFGLLSAGAIGAVIIQRTLRPLHRVAATASRVAQLPLDRGEVALAERVPEADTDPRTEVGRVGAALNTLLGHVGSALAARHASETRVRQFVADASHELRTPLAAIRGYAELTRRTDAQVPAEVARALGRVESEAARMTTLVEDLLLLARLDSGRPLERAPVDLSLLAVNAVSDAHAAGPDHQWKLDLPHEPVTVVGDTARLHQVLANLLANARTHTPPGTTVTARLESFGGGAVLTVADDGPGIPSDLQPEVFERFARADSSRSRAEGSTGLGLAIVAAVVAAHHGTVAVTSIPGRTVFTVRLPHFDEAAQPSHSNGTTAS
jgi:two-component system OmpR family sensor kinase